MRNTIALSLSFFIFVGSLIPRLDLEELAKVPFLLKHYYEHTQSASSLSFTDFLSMHYNSDAEHAQQPEHEQLPFFNHEMPNLVFIIIPKFEFELKIQPVAFAFNSFIKNEYFFLSSISLFQPPKA